MRYKGGRNSRGGGPGHAHVRLQWSMAVWLSGSAQLLELLVILQKQSLAQFQIFDD